MHLIKCMRRSVVDLHFSGWRNLKIDSNGVDDECDSTKRAKNMEKSSRTTAANSNYEIGTSDSHKMWTPAPIYVYRVLCFSIDAPLKGMQLYFIIELKPEWLTFNFRDNFMREIHIFREKPTIVHCMYVPLLLLSSLLVLLHCTAYFEHKHDFDWVMCDMRCRGYYEPPAEYIIASIYFRHEMKQATTGRENEKEEKKNHSNKMKIVECNTRVSCEMINRCVVSHLW